MVESTTKLSGLPLRIYVKTSLLVISWLVLGICGEIIGPTIAILAYNNHVTYNGIASALAARSAGGLVTNVLCGIFQQFVKNYPDLMLTMAFFSLSLIVFATPNISLLALMCALFFVQGASGSFAVMGGTHLLLQMWDSHVTAAINIVHLGYAIGAIFANFVVRPFLNHGSVASKNETISTPFDSALIHSDIRVPYYIAAGFSFLTGVGHLIFFIQEQKRRAMKIEMKSVNYTPVSTIGLEPDINSNKMKFSHYSPAICGRGYFGYGLTLSSFFVLYLFFAAGTEQIFSKFYFSYLKFDQFGISTDGASWGIILFWFSFAIGRLIGVILSIFIPIQICLTMIWCAGLLLSAAWLIYVWILGLTATSLLVLGSFTGSMVAPLIPFSFAWINLKLNVIPPLLAALFCGCGLGSLVLQKMAGLVMDRNPNHFPTLLTVCVILTIITYVISNIIIFFHQRSLKRKPSSFPNSNTLPDDTLNKEEKEMVNYLQSVDEIQ